jgi:hypothetical protein
MIKKTWKIQLKLIWNDQEMNVTTKSHRILFLKQSILVSYN